MNGPATRRIGRFQSRCRRGFIRFYRRGGLSERHPVVTLLTKDHLRRVGSGLPTVVRITRQFRSCRVILTKTPSVRSSCCRGFLGNAPIGVIHGGACPLLDRDATTLMADNATALRATLFRIPRIIYCRAPLPRLIHLTFGRIVSYGCVSLIGLVTSGRIIRRVFTSHFRISTVTSRLCRVLPNGRNERHVLSRCHRIERHLNGRITPSRTTTVVFSLLIGHHRVLIELTGRETRTRTGTTTRTTRHTQLGTLTRIRTTGGGTRRRTRTTEQETRRRTRGTEEGIRRTEELTSRRTRETEETRRRLGRSRRRRLG